VARRRIFLRVADNVRALAAVTNLDHEAAMIGRARLIAMGHPPEAVDALLSGGIESVARELERMAATLNAGARTPVAPMVRPAVFVLGDTPVIRRVQGPVGPDCQLLAAQITILAADNMSVVYATVLLYHTYRRDEPRIQALVSQARLHV
jgi:hypothetical protein